MNHHLRVLEEGIKSIAIRGKRAFEQRKWRRRKVHYCQKEDLHTCQDRAGIGVELDVSLVTQPQHKPVGCQQPAP